MSTKQRFVVGLGALLATCAVILQFYLILTNRVTDVPETIIRFFSYFTILTNSLVAVYFIVMSFSFRSGLRSFFSRTSVVAAITVYITMVGSVYQVVLRSTWNPSGLQLIVDEMLHSIVPAYVVLYWIFFAPKEPLAWKSIPAWMIYPLVYFVIVIFRGQFSGFYPYPFIDVSQLGLPNVMLNAVIIVCVFAILGMLFVFLAKSLKQSQHEGN